MECSEVVILIPACRKYRDKAMALRRTWIPQARFFGFRVYFVLGHPGLTETKLKHDFLFVPCLDDYESLLLKLVYAYNFCLENFDFKYIYKIDDDCLVNIPNLVENILPSLDGRPYLAGAVHPAGFSINSKWHFGKCKNPVFHKEYFTDRAPVDFAKGGYGYFLKKDALSILVSKIDVFRAELSECIYSFEDVRVAIELGLAGINVSQLSGYSCRRFNGSPLPFVTVIFDLKSPDEFRCSYFLHD